VTLRTRLLLTVGALLTVALLVSGGLVVGFTRTSLVQQLDDQLRSAAPFETGRSGPGPGAGDPTGRRIALLVVTRNGQQIQGFPSGFGSQPDPLPAIADIGELHRALGGIVELPSVDGSLTYRVLTREGPRGVLLVFAAPLTAVEQPMHLLVRNLLVIGAAVLAAVMLAGWLLIRRDLRPLETITGTAARIAGGDLSRRVELRADGSEVGRLGAAFDSMLDRIQGAFHAQQAALSEKERSEARLRRFVADASHELRTPLTTLRGYVELYRAGGLEDRATLDQAMARIGTESRRMAVLVEDLLLLARLDQGRPLRRDRVDLSDLATDAVADERAIEPGRPVAANVAEGITVTGDEDRLRQVIANLFANVRLHTPADAPLEVSLAARNGAGILTVADHGPGIDPAHADRIFDRFYRADAARSRDRGGTGLGLAIASSVVKAHGGEIAFAPTPGGGATFTVTLPLDGAT
jgi:two-component system, OmpR family, sensor kinase